MQIGPIIREVEMVSVMERHTGDRSIPGQVDGRSRSEEVNRMAGAKTEMKGKKNKAVGGAKKEVGRITKNRDLEMKGAVQKTKGSVQNAAGKATRKVTSKTK